MTDQLRQAAQQALEALEGLFGSPEKWESGGVAVWRLGGSDAPRQAITALLAVLEQQAEPPPEWLLIKNILDEYGLQTIDFVAEFKAAQQVATIWKQQKQQAPFSPEVINTTQTAWKMGYEAAKAEQQQAEPVQERITHITWDERGVRTVNGIPDDAPQRKSLAASEILNMMPSGIPAEYDGELMEFARAVEAKLKERNT